MDENLKDIILKKINRTGEALKKNNMEFHFVESANDVPALISKMLKEGDVVSTGGSITLEQCGVIDMLRSEKYKYLDRTAVAEDEIPQLYRASFSADAYLCSANAITENGELYNVDGASNRIAAICFGPSSVIIVAGYNKLVKNIDEARNRVKSVCAPANCSRLNKATYCFEKGECVALSQDSTELTAGCGSEERICCNYLISTYQRIKNRIKVIVVGEKLGY